jgi:hypothetical protein
MTTRTINPLSEICLYVAGWLRACRANKSHGEQAGVETLQDIVAEAVQRNQEVVAVCHAGETHDREAVRLLDQVLADGKVERSEVAALKRARALTQRSAECDHDASELARVDLA